MVNKTIKIKLNVSNKLLYSIIAILLIIGITAVVYAFNTNTPATFGHSAGELDGVCKSDGTGCSAVGGNDERIEESVKGISVNNNGKLCYDFEDSSVGDCTTEIAYCTESGQIEFFSPNGCTSEYAEAQACIAKCKSSVACEANKIAGCNGALDAKYTTGVSDGCDSNDKLKCTCTVSNKPYTNEIPGVGGTIIRTTCLP